jgi:serine/threonine-protein kinase
VAARPAQPRDRLAARGALIVGGLGVRARILSRREADAAAQVSQDIEEIEWLLRTAYLLPAHDVSLEEGLVRRRMAAIVARTGGGALADYALGRGHLALHEDGPALERLDRARDAGLDTADLHYARGLVLGRLYEQRLAEARRRGGGAWLEERTREIEAQTLAPALAALEKSRGVRLESPSLLDGLIAFYRKDHANAMALGEKARAEAPWLYDGVRLQADAYLARARTRTGPESEAATLDLDQAARLYDTALDIGRSDVSLYRGRTAVWLARAEIAMRGGRAATDPLERAEEWCRLASVIAPRSASPRIMLAEVRTSYSHQLTQGEDPQPVVEAAIDAAREALTLEADNVAAHLALAYARSRLFRHQLSRGVDPKAGLDEMLAHGRRAAELAPLEPRAAYILAKGHMNVASYQLWVGEDPTPSLRSAIAQFQVVTRIAPKDDAGYFAIIQALAIWAEYLLDHGQSPRSLAPAVEQALGDCVRLAGGGYCHLNAAYFHSVLAEYQVDAGLDPDADIDRATALLSSSRSRVDMPARRTLADLSYLRAKAATAAGELDPPRAELESRLAACLGLDAHDPYCLRTSAEAALLFARTPADSGARARAGGGGGGGRSALRRRGAAPRRGRAAPGSPRRGAGRLHARPRGETRGIPAYWQCAARCASPRVRPRAASSWRARSRSTRCSPAGSPRTSLSPGRSGAGRSPSAPATGGAGCDACPASAPRR